MKKHDSPHPIAKARRLAVTKITLRDLDVRKAGSVLGGTQLVRADDPITVVKPAFAPPPYTTTCYCRS